MKTNRSPTNVSQLSRSYIFVFIEKSLKIYFYRFSIYLFCVLCDKNKNRKYVYKLKKTWKLVFDFKYIVDILRENLKYK